jgi:hypothetical protein
MATFIEKLQAKKQNNVIINSISSNLQGVVGKPTWVEFNWKAGKVMGILRTMALNRNNTSVFVATGIEPEIIDMYFDVAGNLPYIDKNGLLNLGRPQMCSEYIELLKYVYDKLNLTYDDTEFDDITEERWNALYVSNMERIKKTLEITSSSIQYDE